jgi:hypothetical protein
MAIKLKIQHREGLRLRQQTAQEVTRAEGNVVTKGTDWKFDKHADYEGRPIDELDQDRDARLIDGAGKKLRLGTYTIHINAGMHNLVVEQKGKVKSVDFKNEAIRNQIRVRYQELKNTGRKTKDGKEIFEWRDAPGAPIYIPPNTWGGAFVGDGQRAILDEMPT